MADKKKPLRRAEANMSELTHSCGLPDYPENWRSMTTHIEFLTLTGQTVHGKSG